MAIWQLKDPDKLAFSCRRIDYNDDGKIRAEFSIHGEATRIGAFQAADTSGSFSLKSSFDNMARSDHTWGSHSITSGMHNNAL